MTAPEFPVGAYVAEGPLTASRREELIAVIASAPGALRRAVAGLSEQQLDTVYKNWTIRQIVHHLADSHVNSYIRFKWTLTEEHPTIKPYDETRWAALVDSRIGDISDPLTLLTGVHACWVQLLGGLKDEEFARSFYHPESKKDVTLNEALGSYAWHCRHHTGQILWLRQHHGW